MEKRYAHLAPNYGADMIQAPFPTLRDCRLNQRRRHEAEEATMVGRVLKADHSAVISAAPQAGVR